MNNSRLKSAVIGTGKISEEHLRFLGHAPQTSLAAVCDLSPSLARYAASKFGAAVSLTDYRQMLCEVKPDVVHVLTPPHTHCQIISDCLVAGAHVISEKPLAPTHADFQRLWHLADEQGRHLIEDHNYRFNRPILAIERALSQGKLGEVREVEVRLTLGIRNPGGRYSDPNLPHPSHKMPAGVIHEFITHLCYLALRFLPDVDRVVAAWRNCEGGDLFKYDDLDALVMAGQARARIRFTCQNAPECFMVTVRGTKGWAETDLFQPYLRLVVPRAGGSKVAPLVNHFANGWGLMRSSLGGFANKVLQHTPLEGLGTFLSLIYGALLSGSQPPVTYDDMDAASRLTEALLKEGNRI